MPIPYIHLEKIRDGRRPSVPQGVKDRVLAHARADLDFGGHDFTWDRWRHLPPKFFRDLTPSEQVALWHSDIISSRLGDHLEKAPDTFLINRIRLCLWYYGCSDDWNYLVEFYTKVCTFDFAEPDFTTTIDHPWGFQGTGTGEFSNRWLDGGLAYMLHYKGEFVAVLGFSVSSKGLLIQQAQATQKKGNRWMYRLGNLLNVMVDKLERHFACPTWIVDGVSQATYLSKIHPSSNPLSVVEIDRIARLYDAPIAGFYRTGESHQTYDVVQTGARLYHRIERTATEIRVAS